MSKKYDNSRDVPTEALTNRLYELSDAVTCGQKGLDREFTMRIPPECDRDADLVLAESARRLRKSDTALAAAEARIAELEKALEPLADIVTAFSADRYGHHQALVLMEAGDARRAAALLKEKH